MYNHKNHSSDTLQAEEILLYTERLENSLYLDDKTNALIQINKISDQNPFLVGIYCLDQITDSIIALKDCHLQKQILVKIFNCHHKNEFIEIFLKRDANVCILVDYLDEMHNLVHVFCKYGGNKVYDILVRNNLLYKIIHKISLCLCFLKYLVNMNNKKMFVVEGILESVLDIIDERNYKACVEILCLVLKDDESSQNYFLELRWKEKMCGYKPVDLFVVLLDLKSKRFTELQEYFCREEFVDFKRIDFLWKLIYQNCENLKKLELLGFDIKLILNNELKDNEKFELIKLIESVIYLREINIECIEETSDIYYYILSVIVLSKIEDETYFKITLKDFNEEIIFNLCKLKEFNRHRFIGFIIYFIICYDNYKMDDNSLLIINSIFKDLSISNIEKSFCALLLSKYFKNNGIIEINRHVLEFYLRNVRKYLENENFLLTDKIKDYLHEYINNFLKESFVNLRSEYKKKLFENKNQTKNLKKDTENINKKNENEVESEKINEKEIKSKEISKKQESKFSKIKNFTNLFSTINIKKSAFEKKDDDVFDL